MINILLCTFSLPSSFVANSGFLAARFFARRSRGVRLEDMTVIGDVTGRRFVVLERQLCSALPSMTKRPGEMLRIDQQKMVMDTVWTCIMYVTLTETG